MTRKPHFETGPPPQGKRFGRPPKPAEFVRSERIVTFVTPNEHEVLLKLSERFSASVSSTVHRLVSQALKAESLKSTNLTGKNHES